MAKVVASPQMQAERALLLLLRKHLKADYDIGLLKRGLTRREITARLRELNKLKEDHPKCGSLVTSTVNEMIRALLALKQVAEP